MQARTVRLTRVCLIAAALGGCAASDAERESRAATNGDTEHEHAAPASAAGAPGSQSGPTAPADSATDPAASDDMTAAGDSMSATPPPAAGDPGSAGVPVMDDGPGLGEFFQAPAVGVLTVELVDTTRGVPATDEGPGSDVRSLVTDVLYPAQARSADARARGRMGNDAAALEWSGAPYPLVIFVHGSLSDRTTSRSLHRAVARAGYIVVAADFPLTSIQSPEGTSDAYAEDEIGDVVFLAGQLMAMNVAPDQLLAGAIAPDRYAVVGHSTGATVALVAQLAPLVHDDRMVGVIAMAPATCFLGDDLFQTRSLPLLVLAGTNDHIVPYVDNTLRPYALVGAPKLLATFVGGKHVGFTDVDVGDEDLLGVRPSTERSALGRAFAGYGAGRTCASIRDAERSGDRTMRFEEQHRRTAEWTVAFLDRILYGASQALSNLEAAGDGAVTVQHDGI